METLYNKQGKATAYVNDDEVLIFHYNGTPLGFLHDEYVYNFNGRYLGWIYNGWYYDRNGRPTFFTENSSGGPARPARQARPARSARQARPARGAREARPAKPARSLSWSPYSDIDYFNQ